MKTDLVTYKEFQKAYDHFNATLFYDELPKCQITMSRKANTAGFYVNKIWEAGKDHMDEISLNPDAFKERSTEETLSTLVHEMCHQWQYHLGTPGRKGYHNKEFSTRMREAGLITSDTGEVGGKSVGPRMTHYVDPSGRFHRHFKHLEAKGFKITWKPVSLTGAEKKTKKAKNKVKYTCPCCYDNIWGKPDMTIHCGCHKPFPLFKGV